MPFHIHTLQKGMNTHQPIASQKYNEPKFLCIKFNQDQGCFAIGHEYGFHVFNSDPVDLRVQRNFYKFSPNANIENGAHQRNGASTDDTAGSGIGNITMLHRTNYLALVGGGKHPKFSSNKLVIRDDLKRKTSLTLEFLSPVLNVLLSRIRIVVVLQSQVLVYGFSSPPRKFATYETISNELGIADLSVNSTSFPTAPNGHGDGESTFNGDAAGSTASILSSNSSTSSSRMHRDKYQILAFPSRSAGQIQLVDVSPTGQEKNHISIIKAHKAKIRCLTLNRLGSLIASASETGTIIRVHSTFNTALLYEFRRGLDRAIVTSMKFSHNDTMLAVLSDKNTLHVFNLSAEGNTSQSPLKDTLNFPRPGHRPSNRQHLFRKLPIPVPDYFKSVWSFCSVNINQYHSHLPQWDESHADVGVMGWSNNDSIVIIWKNKRIWEKYVIIEKPNPVESGESQWQLVRESWKTLEVA